MLQVIAATTPFFVVCTLALALRLYARVVYVKRIHGEDYILIASWVSSSSLQSPSRSRHI